MNGHDELPNVALVPTKRQKGAGRLRDRVGPMTIKPLPVAFDEQWMTDAHFSCYVVRQNGEEAKVWPRLKKVVLDQIEEKDGEVLSTMLVIDYDTKDNVDGGVFGRKADAEGKVPWDQELIEGFWKRVDRATDECGLPVPNVLYTTRNGARFVYVLPEPMNVRTVEDYYRGLVHAFGQAGLVADSNCSDWTRLFRLPKVNRDGKRSWESPFFHLLEQYDTFLDIERIKPIEKLGGDGHYAPVEEIDRSAPSPEGCAKLARENSSLYLEAKCRLVGRNCYQSIFEGVVIAEQGGRDSTLMSYVGEAVALLFTVSGASPEFVYALFLPSVEVLKPDSGTPNWSAKLWYVVTYTWAREEARAKANIEASRSEVPGEAHRAVPGFPEDALPPTVEACLRKAGASLGDPELNLLGPALLSSFSAGVQFHRDSAVSPFHPSGPAGLETLAGAGSGKNKSTGIRLVSDPHWRRQVHLRNRFETERQRFEAEAGARRERMKKRNRDFAREPDNETSKPNEEQALESLRLEAEEMPEEPKSEEYMASDTTGEAVMVTAANNRHEAVYVCSAEGTPLMTALGHYAGKSFFAPWCDMWSGVTVKVDRIRQGGQATFIADPRMAGTYAMQLNKLDLLRANEEAIDEGFLARKLTTLCPETPQLTAAERRKLARPDMSPFYDRLHAILARPVPNERQPMGATNEAGALFDEYHDEVQQERGPGGKYRGKHAPWGNRLVEHVCRLAVNVEALWNGIDSPAVSAASMERAIRIIRYFDAHYWALFADGQWAADPVVEFATERIVEEVGGKLFQSGLYEEFTVFCKNRTVSAPPDNQGFWRRLKSLLGVERYKGSPRYLPGHRLVDPPSPGGKA